MDSQEHNISTPISFAMKDGAYLGFLFSVNFVVSTSSNGFLQVLSYIITATIAVATWRLATNYRKSRPNGIITFYQAFSYITILYFFAALISALVKIIYLKYIDSDFLSRLIVTTRQVISATHLSLPEDYEDNINSILNPSNFAIQITMFNVFLGVMMGLIYAPFIRRNKNINTNINEQSNH